MAGATTREPASPRPEPAAPSPPSRSEAKNAAVRAELEPLAPGERPGVVTVCVALCAIALVALPIGYATGLIPNGGKQLPGFIASLAILAAAGWGMWRSRYWAVLGFEAILLINLLVMFALLLRASSVLGVVVALAVIVPSGFLFYKLIRAMARIQMPRRQA